MLGVSFFYCSIPTGHQPYRLVTPGAALAVVTWVIASLGVSFYLANFADYSVIYGSLGAAFALLLYFYISAAVLLLGAEVNVAIHHYTSDSNMEEEKEERSTGHEASDVEGRSGRDA